MSHDTPLVIAHRATMGHAPENTLMGIRQALDMRCDGVEVDVQLSADGVPVLFHDDELQRTTNATGPVADRSIRRTRATGRRRRRTGAVPCAMHCSWSTDRCCSLRNSRSHPTLTCPLSVMLCSPKSIAPAHCPGSWLWSFDTETVIELSRRSPHGRRIAHLCVAPTPDIWQIAAEHRLDGISMHGSGLTASNVAACRTHDMAAFVWTVNERADIRHCIELGVTGIVGDYPERIQAALSDDPD